MAKKDSAGTGVLISGALIVWLLVSIPKEIWIGIAVLVAVVWLFRHFTKDKSVEQPDSASSQNRAAPIAWQGKERSPAAFRTNRRSEELVTVTLSGLDGPEYSIPSDQSGRSGKARWVPSGEAVTIASITLPGGMIYVGAGMMSGYDVDPSLINPSLRVSAAQIDISLPLTSYWPSYSSITPEARKGYLQWLSSGRKAPSANIGYVFLFFYGLERRVLIDAGTEAGAMAEIPLIEAEVRRLLEIYKSNNSFRNYAGQFLCYIAAGRIDEKTYHQPPPPIHENAFDLPMPLRIGLGQLALDKKPVPVEWALAWAQTDPCISRRTAVTRCEELFAKLFKKKYTEAYGEGLVLKVNRTKLKINYRAASSGLRYHDSTRTIGDLPDVSAVKGPISKLQDLVNDCTTELDPYSRYIGRNQDKAQSLEGLLQLPAALWPSPVKAELDDIRLRVGDGIVLMGFGELSGRLKSAGDLSRDKVIGLARALEGLHLGMEPDVLAGAKIPKAEDKIALFATHPEDGTVRSGAAYSVAALTLDLACIAALADGEASAHELILITKQVESWGHLSEAHRKRLKAHLRLGIDQPATLASLKKKLAPLPMDAKYTIVRFLAHLAHADGKVTPDEVKFLEKVYKIFGLETQQVYSDLHIQAGAGVPSAAPASSAASVPATGFALNAERIAELQKETEAVSALLANVFSEDTHAEALPEELPVVEEVPGVLGLDKDHSAFLRRLVSRHTWSRGDLVDMATDMELMLDGALERINEIILDFLDEPLVEGEDPVEINQELLEKLPL